MVEHRPLSAKPGQGERTPPRAAARRARCAMSQASMSLGFASFDSSNRSDTGGRRWGGKGSSRSSHLDSLRGLRKAIFLLWAAAASEAAEVQGRR